jgi:hypothetical protein
MAFTEQQKEELSVIVRLVVTDPCWARMSILPEQATTEAWVLLRAKERQLCDFNAARYAFARNALRVLEDELQRKMRDFRQDDEHSKRDKDSIVAAINHVFQNEHNARDMLLALINDETTLKHWVHKHCRDDGRTMPAYYKEVERNKKRLLKECLDEHKAAVSQMMTLRSKPRRSE